MGLGAVLGAEDMSANGPHSLPLSNQLHLAFSTCKSHFITSHFLKASVSMIFLKESCVIFGSQRYLQIKIQKAAGRHNLEFGQV